MPDPLTPADAAQEDSAGLKAQIQRVVPLVRAALQATS